MKARKDAARAASGAGQKAMWLLTPQVATGALLALLPDSRAPRLAQVLVLLHVASAVASMLALVVWVVVHARRSPAPRPAAKREPRAGGGVLRSLVVAGIAAAYATGVWDAWGGEGSTAGNWHAAVGLLAGLPLALHLLLDGRRAARRVAWLYLFASPLAVPDVRAVLRPAELPVAAPPFAAHTRDASLYDRAEWCGSCHVDQFDEWAHSLHARALAIPELREGYAKSLEKNGADHVDGDLDTPGAADGEHCVRCHAPSTFYGRDAQPALQDTMLATQGISCSFCHTARSQGTDKLFNSVPETVTRYLGQNAPRALARDIGDLLIRWRPEQHRRDYFAPFLAQSAFCRSCHAEAYEGWERSAYGDPKAQSAASKEAGVKGPVACQDCHMAHRPTSGVVEEPGRLVPWGAVRPQKRFHGVTGRNIRAAETFHDPIAARADRALRPGMMTLRIADITRDESLVRVKATLRNDHVGHFFPTGDSGDVVAAYLELELLDAAGDLVARSRELNVEQIDDDAPGRLVALTPRFMNGRTLKEDRRVPPLEERSYALSLRAERPFSRVRVKLRSAFEPEPILSAEAPSP